MKQIQRVIMASTFAIAALVPMAASAHAIWFAQRAKQIALIYGVGADDLDSAKRLPLIQSVGGFDADFKPVETKLRIAGPMVMVDSEGAPSLITAVMFNGIWCKLPDGEWVKKGKDEVPNCLISEKNFKYTVHIAGPLSGIIPPIPDQVLQIVPAVKELPAKMGDGLKLIVLFHGKPVAGARVLRDMVNDPDAKPVMTNSKGEVTIKVRNQGLNVVNAVFDGPTDEPAKSNKIEHEATLSFVLAHAPE